ncbi:hypothetical protein B0T22DRAFT_530781 [Podospora appendiculata]|uniref:Serine/threonine-protein phosphatase 2A activator n=1 Tax=Podospora appendiculata TaxID=314037 RepID=A0AAE1C862_9PEZI|nr:hypothetical protein B0T22DRAFT_530781 [Podospora appendiculata]
MEPPKTSPATATTSAAPPPPTFPKLEILDPSTPHRFLRPVKRINEGPDVARFLTSQAYRDIGIFVLQLNRSLCPRKPPHPLDASCRPPGISKALYGVTTFPTNSYLHGSAVPEPVVKLQRMLDTIEAIIDEAPPDPGPRRFGNASFRTWHRLLEERVDALLRQFLPAHVLEFGQTDRDEIPGDQDEGTETEESEAGPLDELRAYFLGGFGSAQRLDYGTGHELSFVAFLGCLWKLGYFKEMFSAADRPLDETERCIVLGVIEPYLKVVRRLILTYTLEPAGSHGVWGLDDHFFMPYIFGSAQLTRPITETEPMPVEGSLPYAPPPSTVATAAKADSHRAENMYFSAIGFINDVKTGPFWEHSPILFDISGIKDGWGKINKGMIKMYNAEVLSKFPVVQHFPFGSLFAWDADPNAAVPTTSVHMANQPIASAAAAAAPMGTSAPWAQATRMPGAAAGNTTTTPGIPYSQAPWAGGRSSAGPALPRGGAPGPVLVSDPSQMTPATFSRGTPGTASHQFAVTKAPWAKD